MRVGPPSVSVGHVDQPKETILSTVEALASRVRVSVLTAGRRTDLALPRTELLSLPGATVEHGRLKK